MSSTHAPWADSGWWQSPQRSSVWAIKHFAEAHRGDNAEASRTIGEKLKSMHSINRLRVVWGGQQTLLRFWHLLIASIIYITLCARMQIFDQTEQTHFRVDTDGNDCPVRPLSGNNSPVLVRLQLFITTARNWCWCLFLHRQGVSGRGWRHLIETDGSVQAVKRQNVPHALHFEDKKLEFGVNIITMQETNLICYYSAFIVNNARMLLVILSQC